MVVGGQRLGFPDAVRGLEHGAEAVRRGLVGAEQAEVGVLCIEPHHVAQKRAEYPRGLAGGASRFGYVRRVVPEVGQLQITQQHTAVGVRIGAHPSFSARRQLGQLRSQGAGLVEELLGPVGAHPLLELDEVLRIARELGDWNLVGAKGALGRQAVDHLRPGPALGRAQDDHRPIGAPGPFGAGARVTLDLVDLVRDLLERGCHQLVHRRRV